MKDSIGMTFLLGMVLTFFVLYISFMAVAINYAKTFRVKNGIIDRLEQLEYGTNVNYQDIYDDINDYLDNAAYSILPASKASDCSGTYLERGVCIEPKATAKGYSYYKVTVYIAVDFPFFNIQMTLPISGETKTYTWDVSK